MTKNEVTEKEYKRLEIICKESPVVDAHNDFPYLLRVQLHNEFESSEEFEFDKGLKCHTDLAKLKEGKIGVQFFSCFIECKNDDYLYQDFNIPNSAVRDTMEQIDVIKRLTAAYPSDLEIATSFRDAIRIFESGKIAIAMGVEGLHQIDLSLGVLRQYHDLGVRYITLTHNCDNAFATAASSVVAGLPDKGLSKFGVSCIKEMNRLGMIVDLSHVSLKTMYDALAVSNSPVIFSHSSVYSLTKNERNVRDEILLKLKDNGGVICINFFPLFISKLPHESSTIQDAVDHILYVVNLIGWEHVGFGSDFDGIPSGSVGLDDVSKYPELILKIMQDTSATDEQIKMMMGGNTMRVWRENELISHHLNKIGERVTEDNWEDREWSFYEYVNEFPEVFTGSKESKQNSFKNSQTLDLTRAQD